MRRLLLASLTSLRTLLLLGAGMSGASMLSVDVMAEQLPVPPQPPEPLSLAQIAPVPNVNARGPIMVASDAPTLDLKLYRARPYDPGMGFAPGSRYQTAEDRKPIQTPGLAIIVPLK